MANCVEFASTNSSPSMSRAYTVAWTSASGYMRLRWPNTALGGYIIAVEATAGTFWYISSGSDNIMYGEASDMGGAGYLEIRTSFGTSWTDIAWTRNGGNTDYYHKLASESSWSGPSSADGSDFTPATFTYNGAVNNAADGDFTTRYAKLCIWSTALSGAALLNETGARTLVNTGNCFFYNDCTDASAVGTDAGGGGNNFTVTGTPTTVTDDDPGFSGGGGGGAAETPQGGVAFVGGMGMGLRAPARDSGRWTRGRGERIWRRAA